MGKRPVTDGTHLRRHVQAPSTTLSSPSRPLTAPTSNHFPLQLSKKKKGNVQLHLQRLTHSPTAPPPLSWSRLPPDVAQEPTPAATAPPLPAPACARPTRHARARPAATQAAVGTASNSSSLPRLNPPSPQAHRPRCRGGPGDGSGSDKNTRSAAVTPDLTAPAWISDLGKGMETRRLTLVRAYALPTDVD